MEAGVPLSPSRADLCFGHPLSNSQLETVAWVTVSGAHGFATTTSHPDLGKDRGGVPQEPRQLGRHRKGSQDSILGPPMRSIARATDNGEGG